MWLKDVEAGRNQRVVKLRDNEILYAEEKGLTVYNMTTYLNQSYAIWNHSETFSGDCNLSSIDVEPVKMSSTDDTVGYVLIKCLKQYQESVLPFCSLLYLDKQNHSFTVSENVKIHGQPLDLDSKILKVDYLNKSSSKFKVRVTIIAIENNGVTSIQASSYIIVT